MNQRKSSGLRNGVIALFLVLSHSALSVAASLPYDLKDDTSQNELAFPSFLSSDAASAFGRTGGDARTPFESASDPQKFERGVWWQGGYPCIQVLARLSLGDAAVRSHVLLALDRQAGRNPVVFLARLGNSDGEPPCVDSALAS